MVTVISNNSTYVHVAIMATWHLEAAVNVMDFDVTPGRLEEQFR